MLTGGLGSSDVYHRLRIFSVAVGVLAVRGRLPFHSEALQHVILSMPAYANRTDEDVFIAVQRMLGIGLSWNLLLTYPSYCLTERIGPRLTAAFGLFLNTLAYVYLSYGTPVTAHTAIFLFALSSGCLVNSHAEIAYLFPGNASMILVILGAATELSAYGPWFLAPSSSSHRFLRLMAALSVTLLCLTLDLWMLPSSVPGHPFPRAEAPYRRRRVSLFSSSLPRAPFDVFSGYSARVGRVASAPPRAGGYADGVRMRTVESGSDPPLDDMADVSSTYFDDGAWPSYRPGGPHPLRRRAHASAASLLQQPGTPEHRGPGSGASSRSGPTQRAYRYATPAQQPATQPTRGPYRIPQQATFGDPVPYECVDDSSRYRKRIFCVLLGFFTVAFLRHKWILLGCRDIMFEFEKERVTHFASEVVERNSFVLNNLVGLSGLGFFYWSVVYWRRGLLTYMMLCNLSGVLALMCFFSRQITQQGFATIIFMIHQSSVAGLPIAVYASVFNWDTAYVHAAGTLCVAAGAVSVLSDFVWPYYVARVLGSLTLANGHFLVLSGLAFAAPATLLLLAPQCTQRYSETSSSDPCPKTPRRASLHAPARPPLTARFIPLYPFFNGGQLLEAQRRRERLLQTAAAAS